MKEYIETFVSVNGKWLCRLWHNGIIIDEESCKLKSDINKCFKHMREVKKMNEKKLYDINEAAEEIGMSWSWLDKKIRDGKVKVIWMGGVRKISYNELVRITVDGIE